MRVGVIGSGSWGTALAQVAARNGHPTMVWARRESVASSINDQHRNPDYLSHFTLSSNIEATSAMDSVISQAEALLVVVPSKYLRGTAEAMVQQGLDSKIPVVLCTKGVEGDSGFVPIQLFEDVAGNPDRLACLSGPNHAEEVIEAIPSGTVVASTDPHCAQLFQELLGSANFRVYTSDDTIGVELCAAAKNVIAIAVGISYGLGFGDNTAAMLMTRGQAEMGRLVEACGGSPLTCMGLAGTGDLIATCTSRHSRNRAFGEALAAGESLESFEGRRHMVVEGAQACRSIRSLAKSRGVELPLADAVDAIVWEGCDPLEVGRELTTRSFKPEFY